MTARTLNAEGVDAVELASTIERWLAFDPDRTAAMLAEHAGINPRGIWQLRNHQRPACSLDWADRLTLAMDVPLNAVAPTRDVESDGATAGLGPRRGKRLGAHVNHISPDDLKLAHDLHWRGVPLRRIARAWQQSGRITYATENAAVSSLYSLFEARGWSRRDRIEMVRRVSTKHGRAGRAQARRYGPDYAAYRRTQRKRNGDLRDVRCAVSNKSGEPCKRWALAGKQHCVTHDPDRAAERARTMQAAWAASRARMLRWGDYRPAVQTAVDQHGQSALARASGVCVTVIGRMLRYDEEQPIKPETWAKLEWGITRLSGDARSHSSQDFDQHADI
ncbi:MAG: hypothetical protein JWM86_1860 [Thermoleophilia bacterium]|nr:hypothetical protein [Thermoleophilia bacterium]